MRVVQQTCAFLACLVMVISCGGGGTSTGDGTPGERPLEPEIPETMDPQEQIPVSVQLSDSNQETAQGKTVIFDYSGPELNEEDLTVRVGDTEVPTLLSETQIYILLPLSESGETTATFEFPGDKTASVQLNIAEAPTIENPEVYVSDQVAEVVSVFESLRDEYPDVWELLEQAQDQIAGLSEDEARELAILFKQNIEPLLDTPEISEVDAMGFEETGSLEFAAARSSGGRFEPTLLSPRRFSVTVWKSVGAPCGRSFIIRAGISRSSDNGSCLFGSYIDCGNSRLCSGLIAIVCIYQ